MAEQIGSKGQELNLLIRQGGTFGPFRMTLRNPDGTPVNLSDSTFRGQIRKTPDALEVVASFVFTVTDPIMGKVEFEVPAAQTAAIMAGIDENAAESLYVYDIEYTNEADRVLPLVYGVAKIFREVTK